MMANPQSRQEPTQNATRSFSLDANMTSQHPKSPTAQTQQIPRTRSIFAWRPAANVVDPDIQREQTAEDSSQLSFFQKHFTRPVATDPEKRYTPENRRFAIASHGFIIAVLAMLLILLAILGAALGATLGNSSRHPHENPEGSLEGTQDPSGGSDGSQGGSSTPSPIRAALLDNFPDPTLIYANNTWYAFATNNAAGILERPDNASSYEYGTSNVQVATSTNFVNWTLLSSSHDPLPDVGMWAAQGKNMHTDPPIPHANVWACLLYTSPSPRDGLLSRMPSSA